MQADRHKKRDPWLVVLWLAVAILGPFVLAIFVAGLPLAYEFWTTVCPAACEDNRLTAAAADQWLAAGASMELYATIGVVMSIALAVLCFGIAAFLLIRRPRDRMAVFVALMFILLGATYSEPDELIGRQVAWLTGPTDLINQVGFGLFPILLLTFPDGRFVPRWSRWPALAVLLFAVGSISVLSTYISDTVFLMFFPIWALLGPAGQVYRYKRISNPIQKQQTKWIVAGFILGAGGFTLTAILGVLAGVPDTAGPVAFTAVLVAGYLFIALIPISIAIGVLRYRLWDIDVIVRKTLVYAVLTGLLALVYFGTVIVLQTVFGSLTGEQSPVVIVISTLVIAALFGTLRRRVQTIIDRRFFRQKYDAEQVLARFAQTARDEVELEALTAEMLAMVEETMRPALASVWIRPAARRAPGRTNWPEVGR